MMWTGLVSATVARALRARGGGEGGVSLQERARDARLSLGARIVRSGGVRANQALAGARVAVLVLSWVISHWIQPEPVRFDPYAILDLDSGFLSGWYFRDSLR